MKKFFVVALILFLILFTALIKNSTKRIDDDIFVIKDSIRALEKEFNDLKLEYNYLSSGKKLLELQSKFFEEHLKTKKSYEIKKDLAEIVKESNFYKNNNSILFRINKNKYLFDLPLLLKESLKQSKIHDFGDVKIDTYQKSNLFFSHRKSTHENFPQKAKTGRHISVIGIY